MARYVDEGADVSQLQVKKDAMSRFCRCGDCETRRLNGLPLRRPRLFPRGAAVNIRESRFDFGERDAQKSFTRTPDATAARRPHQPGWPSSC